MKKLLLLLLFGLFMFSCVNNQKSSDTNKSREDKESSDDGFIPCDDFSPWGNIDICLPKIDGMTECYSSPTCKEYFDQFSDLNVNTTFGVYIKSNIYNNWQKTGTFKPEASFDEYFKFYAVNEAKEFEIGITDMRYMMDEIVSMYPSIQDAVRESDPRYAKIGETVFIESYFPHDNVVTHIKTSKRKDGIVQVNIGNVINIKNRMIWMGYIKIYDTAETMKYAKRRNEHIISQFVIANHLTK